MSSGPAPVIASKTPDPPAIVADAKDLKVLRKAVEDASTVGVGLWVSYLFVLFYLLVAAGSVTHKDLFFETAVKLPFLGVDLPLKGFFVLGPLLFLIVHAYVLLHFAMLSGKVRVFDTELRGQIDDGDIRTRLRRQLPSSIFVQFLAGPSEVRDGTMGGLLWLIAMVSLMIGPILLLIFFALQFLPYHNEAITWWQRGAVGVDLWLMWVFWPRIAVLDGAAEDLASATQRMIVLQRRLGRGAMWGLTGGSALLLLLFATFPGETIDEALWQPKGFLPRDSGAAQGVKPPAWQEEWPFPKAGRWVSHIPGAVRAFLVEGAVQPASRTPESLWSNRLVLPGLDMVVHLKLDSEDKIKFLPETVSLRDRDLTNAVLIDAVLRKADFTGARMGGVLLDRADLRGTKMGCADWLHGERMRDGTRRAAICTDLRGASLVEAQLQGALLGGAQLHRASLRGAQLQGASLDGALLQAVDLSNAKLQGASLDRVQLQGALLDQTLLQGASLKGAQLQDATLFHAQLQGAILDGVQLRDARLSSLRLQGASLVRAQLQGSEFIDFQLQGASLNDAQLQGVTLVDAKLQGASLVGAELQGAILYRPQLQGAVLDYSQLHGAALFDADLRGASLDFVHLEGSLTVGAQLQGTSLRSVFAWRANVQSATIHDTWVQSVHPYTSAECASPERHRSCDWTVRNRDDLVAMMKQKVPDGRAREAALQRIDQHLDPSVRMPSAVDAALEAWWTSEASRRPPNASFEAERAKQWQSVGCSADGAPYVIVGMARRLDPAVPKNPRAFGVAPFSANSPEPAKLAAAFLDERCEGARGLSDTDKAILVKLRGPVAATPPSPPPAAGQK